MPLFNLSCAVTVSAYTNVEADTLEEAIKIASGRYVELSFNGSGNDADDVWLIEDGDGIPENIHDAG